MWMSSNVRFLHKNCTSKRKEKAKTLQQSWKGTQNVVCLGLETNSPVLTQICTGSRGLSRHRSLLCWQRSLCASCRNILMLTEPPPVRPPAEASASSPALSVIIFSRRAKKAVKTGWSRAERKLQLIPPLAHRDSRYDDPPPPS